MIEFIEKGGGFLWVLLGLAVIAMLVVFERVLFYQRTKIQVGDLMLGLANHVRKGDFEEALKMSSRVPGSVAMVAHAVLLRHDLPRADLRDVAREAGQLEVPRIERNLRGLYAIALIAPMVGMLGTINGLIRGFQVISAGSMGSNASLASCLYESLITTGVGLLVAVSVYVFYMYFYGRSQRLVFRIERSAVEIVNIICDARSGRVVEDPACEGVEEDIQSA